MCCYREIKNFDRFIRLTQSIVLCTLQQLQAIQQNEDVGKEAVEEEKEEEEKNSKRKSSDNAEHAQVEAQTKQMWSQQDRERLFHLLSKIFLLNFPLYIAMKHGGVINPLAPVKVRLYIVHLDCCYSLHNIESFFIINRMRVAIANRTIPRYQHL